MKIILPAKEPQTLSEIWEVPDAWVTAPLDANTVEQFKQWLELRPNIHYMVPLPEPDAIVE